MLAQFAPHAAAFAATVALASLVVGGRRFALESLLAVIAILTPTWLAYHADNHEPAIGASGFTSIRVVSYNAHGAHDASFVDWLREQDADLVCLVDQPHGFVESAPWIAERYPFRVEPQRGLMWSIILLSKHPAQMLQLAPITDETRYMFMARRSVRVEFPSGAKALFTSVHPPSPRAEAIWKDSLEIAERHGALLGDTRTATGLPIIVAGDFNSTPTGRSHRIFAEKSGLRTWAGVFGDGTWPSSVPQWLAVPIDHVWTSGEIRAAAYRVGPKFASDHFPIVADLRIPNPRTP